MFYYFLPKKSSLVSDILAGITISLVLVPISISFAFISEVNPLTGLYASVIMVIITAAIGGRPGMISGPASAMAVVSAALVVEHGIEYLFAALILMGLLQIVAGIFRLGMFMRLVPHSVMLGFVNGLAIVIFLSQLSQFQNVDPAGNVVWMSGSELWIMLSLVAFSMLIIHFLPKLTNSVPASLVAVVVSTLIVEFFHIPTRSIGDIALIEGGFPSFSIPTIPFDFQALEIILPYAGVLAVIGLIQSHMTLQFIDEVTESRGRGSKEFVAQGIANIVTGFFQGMGGCATIPLSVVNINSGGRGRISGVVAGIFLMLYILFAYPLIEMIPIASLVGVMFIVVLSTFEWSSFRLLGKIPKSDAFVIVLVSLTTVFTDMAVAVILGVIVSALAFAWERSKQVRVDIYTDDEGIKHYEIHGPLFFASTKSFQKAFDKEEDPQTIMIDFKWSRVCDHSSIQVLSSLIDRYNAAGKKVLLRNLSPDCRNAVTKAGIHPKKIVK